MTLPSSSSAAATSSAFSASARRERRALRSGRSPLGIVYSASLKLQATATSKTPDVTAKMTTPV